MEPPGGERPVPAVQRLCRRSVRGVAVLSLRPFLPFVTYRACTLSFACFLTSARPVFVSLIFSLALRWPLTRNRAFPTTLTFFTVLVAAAVTDGRATSVTLPAQG